MWDERGRGAVGAAGALRADPWMGPGNPGNLDPIGVEPTLSPREVVRALERVRRHRLVRIVSLGVLVPAVLLLPGAFSDKGLDLPTLIGILMALVGAALAFLLNRFKLVSTASYVLIFGLLAAIAWDIASKPLSQKGLDLNDLRLYGFFVLPVLLSGVLTGRRGPFIIAGLAIAFTVASLLILPQTPTLQAYWNGTYPDAPGMSYDVVIVPVAILILTAVASWLGADSVQRALLGALRAEELAAANERIVAQAREIEFHRRRLQDGITHMQYVHNAFARGQYDARARVSEGALSPLAFSLNQLLDRLQRLAREQEQRMRMEQGAHALAASLKRLRAGEPYVLPDYTGTALDEVLVELATLRPQAPGPAGPSRSIGPVAGPHGAPRPYAAPDPFAPDPFAPDPFAPDPFAPASGYPNARPDRRPGALPDAWPSAAPGGWSDAAALPPSPSSRAPGWGSGELGNPPAAVYRPDVASDGGFDAGGGSGPLADVAPAGGEPAGPLGTLDPRELLPDWLRHD